MRTIFLSMILFAALGLEAQSQNDKHQTMATTIYIIRHAEKDTLVPDSKNPHLTQVGKARANHWNQIFEHIAFDKVYATNYHRTIETAQPTADRCQTSITLYATQDLTDIDTFVKTVEGKTVLLVGHSNTITNIANKLIGMEAYPEIDESIYGNLYLVTIMDGKASGQLLTIN